MEGRCYGSSRHADHVAVSCWRQFFRSCVVALRLATKLIAIRDSIIVAAPAYMALTASHIDVLISMEAIALK
jgi:hypothetical protein